MKILMVNPSASAGAFIHKLCNALAEEGASVELWTGPVYEQLSRAWQPATYHARIQFYKRTQWRSWTSRFARPFWRVARFLGHCWSVLRLLAVAHRYDVVHVHFLSVPAVDVLWLRALRRRTAVAYTVHNLYPHDADRSSGLVALFRRIYHASDVLFVHTAATADGLMKDFGVDRLRIVQLPHGNLCDIIPPHLVPDASSLDLHDEGPPVVLMLGELRRNKGPDVLLEAAAQLRRRGVAVRILFAGRHPAGDPTEYRHLADRLGVTDMAEFRPHFIAEEEVPAYLRAASIVAFPYLAIDQSGGAIWAISHGRPIIASRVGGLVELIDGGAAIGVDPGDALGLANAIEALIVKPIDRERMGVAGRRYAEKELAWKPIAQRILAAYQTARHMPRSLGRGPCQEGEESP